MKRIAPIFCLLAAGLVTSMALAQTITHVEETNPAITYAGTWYTNTSTANTSSLAWLTNARNSLVSLTFTGTGITWMGVKDPFAGLAWIYLDGTVTTVNTYATATQYKQPLFAVHNLAAGTHTLTIEVPHIRDASGQGSWVWIDGFDIENGQAIVGGTSASAGRVEETNGGVKFTGAWSPQSSPNYSGGAALLAGATGATASITFNGTSIVWITFRDQWSGIANVYLDGALKATVDTYLATAEAEYPGYSIGGLAPGTHTLSIEVTGNRNPSSAGTGVWVDGFQIVGNVGAQATTGPPAISAGGVVNAASYSPAPNNPVAAGQIIAIFGANFLGANVPASGHVDATALPLPTQLGSGNTTVTACSQSIPLFTATTGQINAQVPWECPSTGNMQVIVSVGGQVSASQNVNLASAAPGIFTTSATGSGDGAILHADNVLVSATRPAIGGEQVVIFATGLGPTNPAFATGAAASKINATVNPVTVTIGGINATVVYSGLAVGFAGLYQVNAIVPTGLSGSQPIVVKVGSTATSRDGVTLAVVL